MEHLSSKYLNIKSLERLLMLTICTAILIPTLEAADTLKINQTVKHILNATGQPYKKTTIRQQFYTYDDTLFREIAYSETTGRLSSYMFYFYKSGKLFTQEMHHANDSLLYLLKHEYDQNGNEIKLTKLVPGSGTMAIAERKVNSLDKVGKMLQQKTFYKKKTAIISRYVYNQAGLLESEKSQYKPAAKNNLKQITTAYSYTPEGKVHQVSISGTEVSGKAFLSTRSHTYNTEGKLASVKIVSSDSLSSGEIIYKYLPSGEVNFYEERNADGKLIQLLEYTYNKHYMDRGTQVSYYENL